MKRKTASSVESCKSIGSTCACAINLKACAPLTVYVIVRRKWPGVSDEKVRSKPATPLGGMTCGGHCLMSGSSARSIATKQFCRNSERTVKDRVTLVKTENVPKSIVFGPPVIEPSSSGFNVALHSCTSSLPSGRGLYFLPPVLNGSKSCDDRPAFASYPSP